MKKLVEMKCAGSGKIRSKGEVSDDSDEDYMVEEVEDVDEEDEEKVLSDEEEYEDEEEQYCSDSFEDVDKFEDSDEEEMSKIARSKRKSGLMQNKLGMGAFNNRRPAQRTRKRFDDNDQTVNLESEEEFVEVTRSKRRRSCLNRKKSLTKASTNSRYGHREMDDKDYNVEVGEDNEDQKENFKMSDEEKEVGEVTRSTNRSCLDSKELCTKGAKNRRNGDEEIDDEDYYIDEEEEEEEEDDEEFTLEDSVSLDEEEFDWEEDLNVKKVKRNNKLTKRTSRKKSSVSRNKNKSTLRVKNVKSGKKRKRSSNLRGKLRSEDDEDSDDYENGNFIYKRERRGSIKNKPHYGKRKFTIQSDSEFVDSGPSDAKFTISEEEREQVREASIICQDLTVSSRSLHSNNIQNNESFAQRKPFVTKGKKKIQEVVKQMCGICFSEEGKKTVRGKLNCCNHYFCFTCILEWSKVESRCPLCKQRFLTISKPVKANSAVDSRDVVVQVPERDQVYQPTEEEIRGYLDPYENVICTECHEGGDDELMLLCDLCDSPAHTYCVGLGQEVPEGNWYCEGCRPVSLGASNNQAQDSLTGQRNLFHRLSSFDGNQNDFDASLSTPFGQGFRTFPLPRYFGGGIQSPRSGPGAVTVSGRRQIHRQMQTMFSSHSTRQAIEAHFDTSASNSQANQTYSTWRTSPQIRIPEVGTIIDIHLIEEFHNQPTQRNMQYIPPTRIPEVGDIFDIQLAEEPRDLPFQQNMQRLPVRSDYSGAQMVLDTSPTPGDSFIQGTFRPADILTLHDDQTSNLHIDRSSNLHNNYHLSSSTLGEGGNFFVAEKVLPLVQNYLASISITSSLDSSTVEEIARKSMNTILAACGYQHHPAEVFPMQPQPICTHIEDSLTHCSPMKGNCNSCYDNFAKEVVKTIMNSKLPPFLHVRN